MDLRRWLYMRAAGLRRMPIRYDSQVRNHGRLIGIRNTMTTYAEQSHWHEIQQFLPQAFQLRPTDEPTEEWWRWQRHQIHLDCYRNPDAPLKVILFHGVGTNGRQMSTILGAPLARR